MKNVIALVHEENGTYGVSFPDFPGCVSGGGTLDEALARGAATLEFHVRGMVEDGDPLPAVRSYDELKRDPAFTEDAAGAIVATAPLELPGRAVRINVSIEERLLDAIDRAAKATGETRSGYLARAAERRIREDRTRAA